MENDLKQSLASLPRYRIKEILNTLSLSTDEQTLEQVRELWKNEQDTELGRLMTIVLARKGDTEALDRLFADIKSNDYITQKKAAIALTTMGGEVTDRLIELLGDSDPTIARLAVRILRDQEEKNIGLLLSTLETASNKIKTSIIKVLGSVKDNDKVIISLIKTMAIDQAQVNDALVDALVEIGPRVIGVISKVLKNCNERVASLLFRVLGRIGEPAKSIIMEHLESDQVILRRGAARNLFFLKTKEEIEKLTRSLLDSDRQVAENTFHCLLEMRTLPETRHLEADIFYLVRDILNREGTPRNGKLWCLRYLMKCGRDIDFELNTFFKSEDPEMRLLFVTAVDKVDAQVFNRLVQCLNDTNFFVREEALQLLAKYGEPYLPMLIQSLGDSREDVKQGILSVLKKIGEPAFEMLLEQLRRGQKETRFNCAFALGQYGDKRAIPALRQATKDGDDWVRDYAIKSLGMLGDIETLVELMRSPDETIRQSAMRALSGAGAEAVRPLLEVLRLSPPDKREGIARAMMAIGPEAREVLEQEMRDEEDENIRFWLLKVIRSVSRKANGSGF